MTDDPGLVIHVGSGCALVIDMVGEAARIESSCSAVSIADCGALHLRGPAVKQNRIQAGAWLKISALPLYPDLDDSL